MAEKHDGMEVFVKVDEYKEVLDIVNLIKTRLTEAKDTLKRINKLKNEEDAELELWQTSMEEAERRIEYIDRTLFEPEAI